MALADDLYEKLTDEEDSRLCDEIDEAACRETPQSFVLILASQFLTRLGDALIICTENSVLTPEKFVKKPCPFYNPPKTRTYRNA